jgi:hypothetical protein
MGDLLNQVIADAVDRVRRLENINIVYADPTAKFAGHAVCEPDPYVKGAVATNPIASYHPTYLGHAAYAALVEENM